MITRAHCLSFLIFWAYDIGKNYTIISDYGFPDFNNSSDIFIKSQEA